MPNVGIHFILAGEVLERWARPGADAPFAPDDLVARSAFLHGAVAPDLGYFPSGDRLFSELVHQVRSAEFARSLLAGARTDGQRAYAWGWVTHMLADLAIHPLINRAAGELVRQAGTVHAHMRVEYGLDLAFFRRHPAVERLRFSGTLEASTIAHVPDASLRTYALPLDVSGLLRAHIMTERVSRAGLTYDRWMTAPLRRPLPAIAGALLRGAGLPLRLLPGKLARSPLLGAIFDPHPPQSWLVAEVDAVIERFPRSFLEQYHGALDGFENQDLVLGGVTDPADPSPRAKRALEELEKRKGGPG